MHPALTRGNGVRASGGARGSDGNWQTWLTQNKPHARSTRVSRTQCPFVQQAGRRTLAALIVVRIHEGQLMPMRAARGSAFVRRTARFDPGHRLFPRRRWRVRAPSSAHVTVVSAVQHASSPSSQGRFESGRSLASRTSPTWQEAPGPDPGGLRFESAVRYSWKVNRPGRRARPLSGARVTPCRSSRPPSAMEGEPAGRLAPAGNRVGA